MSRRQYRTKSHRSPYSLVFHPPKDLAGGKCAVHRFWNAESSFISILDLAASCIAFVDWPPNYTVDYPGYADALGHKANSSSPYLAYRSAGSARYASRDVVHTHTWTSSGETLKAKGAAFSYHAIPRGVIEHREVTPCYAPLT